MTARKSKAIVVDASVLRSAGTTENPSSRLCREALLAMLDYCHRAAYSEDVMAEWKTHASRFSTGWLAAMTARKKLVRLDAPDPLVELQEQLGACLATLEQQNAVDKDFHLLVAAMAGDKTILSRDNKLREILHAAAGDVSVLRRLVFANPAVADEAVTDWLNRGAPAERERCLGHRR